MMRIAGRAKRMLRRMRVLGVARVAFLAKTFLLLLAARLALALLPVQRVLGWKASFRPAISTGNDHARDLDLVRWAIRVVVRRSPLEFVCFPQSLIAAALLHQRGIESKLYYGVTRKDGLLVMHTWLEAEGEFITGGEIAHEYSVIAIY